MHDLKALIANTKSMEESCRSLSNAFLCTLPQGLSLLPITDTLANELLERSTQYLSPSIPLAEISIGLFDLAMAVSKVSPAVYVTTEYFGGHGGQDAVVWDKGIVCFCPKTTGYNQEWPNSPISQALRRIGVVAVEGKDEFDSVDLGRFRETHKWAKSVE